MKSKLLIIGLMISSILAISAHGQTIVQQLILQDDGSADHLLIDISTGKYKFASCNETFSAGGVGTVTITGCTVSLQDITDTRRVVAEIDLCAGTGKADLAFQNNPIISPNDQPPLLEFVISDSNTKDSAFACEKKPVVSR
jgi:hypothetical protein